MSESSSVGIIDRFHQTGINDDKAIIIGSGIMDVLGIRTSTDLDVAVDKQEYRRLRELSEWVEHERNEKPSYLTNAANNTEVFQGWYGAVGDGSYEALLPHTVVIEGVRFLSLDFIEHWKRDIGMRDKDYSDIKLIQQYKDTHHEQ